MIEKIKFEFDSQEFEVQIFYENTEFGLDIRGEVYNLTNPIYKTSKKYLLFGPIVKHPQPLFCVSIPLETIGNKTGYVKENVINDIKTKIKKYYKLTII